MASSKAALGFMVVCMVMTMAFADNCPENYKHMTSIYCGKNNKKLLTCSSYICENPARKLLTQCVQSLCSVPPVDWMTQQCELMFGVGSYKPQWEETESGCYPTDQPDYWLQYNNYVISGDFCSNFPKLKITNNLQFERGDLRFWDTVGDVTVIKSEDGIKSKYGKYMAKVVTGVPNGFLEYEWMDVPSCAKSVQFYYNFVTQETGQDIYNDFMTIKLRDFDNDVIKEVSVSASDISTKPGTSGGVWSHASGWKKVVVPFDGISPEYIRSFRIQVNAQNVGDDFVESAVLFDGLKYNLKP